MKKIRGFYEKMGAFLVDLFQADQPGKGKQELQEELTALRTGSNETVRSYSDLNAAWLRGRKQTGGTGG